MYPPTPFRSFPRPFYHGLTDRHAALHPVGIPYYYHYYVYDNSIALYCIGHIQIPFTTAAPNSPIQSPAIWLASGSELVLARSLGCFVCPLSRISFFSSFFRGAFRTARRAPTRPSDRALKIQSIYSPSPAPKTQAGQTTKAKGGGHRVPFVSFFVVLEFLKKGFRQRSNFRVE